MNTIKTGGKLIFWSLIDWYVFLSVVNISSIFSCCGASMIWLVMYDAVKW